jgi:hypothetical protein
VNESLEALRLLIEVFERMGISYRVGGSLASSVHGIARATMDADLVANIKPHHVEEFSRALEGSYYADAELIRDALLAGQSFNLIHLETYIKIDIFPLNARTYDQISFERHYETENTNFITPEDSILRKLEWYVLSEGSERQWRDVLGVMRMQQNNLDDLYLRYWANELDILELLEKALTEAAKEKS